MISIASVGVLLAVFAFMARRRPFFVCLLLFLWVAYTWRITSVAYIDVAGPVYAVELFRQIGPGRAAPWLLLCYLVSMATIWSVFRPTRLEWLVRCAPAPAQLASDRSIDVLARIIVAIGVAFLAALFAELARSGVVPLFAGIERYVFTNVYAGPIHRAVVKYGIHISFMFGVFYAAGALRGGRPDRRFLYLLLVLFIYLFLVGNRFSAFYSHSCFFLMPYTAVAIRGWVASVGGRGGRASGLVGKVVFGAVLVGLIGFAQYRSLFHTRGFAKDLVFENVLQRVMVIQGELWWTSFERVFQHGQVNSAATFNRLFVNPVVEDRNSTITHLMELEIGDRAYPILELGGIYTGGYPEILFELLGPVLGFGGVLLMAYLTARLMFLLVHAILLQRYIRIGLVFYVAYAFILFSGVGMLNIFSSWKFLVKVGAALGWLLYEEGRDLARAAGRGGTAHAPLAATESP